MDQLIGALAEIAASAARGGAEPQPAQQRQPQTRPQAPAKKTPASAPEQPADARPVAHVRSPHKRHEEHPPSVIQAFHRRSSLLAALVAVETLGPPPALRPRELRGEVW